MNVKTSCDPRDGVLRVELEISRAEFKRLPPAFQKSLFEAVGWLIVFGDELGAPTVEAPPTDHAA